MTHESHTEHKQIFFDQQSQGFQAKTSHLYIFGMGIQLYFFEHSFVTLQNVLDARQANVTLPVMKDSEARYSQTNTELQIMDLYNISDNIKTS